MVTSKHSMRESIEGQLTFSQPEFHVNQRVLPGSEKARRMTVGSGLKCSALLTSASPVGFVLKTLLASSVWTSRLATLTWRVKPLTLKKWVRSSSKSSKKSKVLVIKSRRLLFQLVPKVRHTGGIESGLLGTMTNTGTKGRSAKFKAGKRSPLPQEIPALLHTPRAIYGEHPGMMGKSHLTGQVIGLLKTPSSQLMEGRKPRGDSQPTGTLAQQMEGVILPTPAVRDYRGHGNSKARDTLDSLIEVGVTKGQAGKKTGMKLQPAFVEYLMGYPIGFTGIKED